MHNIINRDHLSFDSGLCEPIGKNHGILEVFEGHMEVHTICIHCAMIMGLQTPTDGFRSRLSTVLALSKHTVRNAYGTIAQGLGNRENPFYNFGLGVQAHSTWITARQVRFRGMVSVSCIPAL